MAAITKQQTEGRITPAILDPQKLGGIELANMKILFPRTALTKKKSA